MSEPMRSDQDAPASVPDAPPPDIMQIYDESLSAGLVCRVCGVLVARTGDYPRAHWDWHEATNGA